MSDPRAILESDDEFIPQGTCGKGNFGAAYYYQYNGTDDQVKNVANMSNNAAVGYVVVKVMNQTNPDDLQQKKAYEEAIITSKQEEMILSRLERFAAVEAENNPGMKLAWPKTTTYNGVRLNELVAYDTDAASNSPLTANLGTFISIQAKAFDKDNPKLFDSSLQEGLNDIFAAICKTQSILHYAGIQHFDSNIGNFFIYTEIDNNGKKHVGLKISDFGLSQPIPELKDGRYPVCGTVINNVPIKYLNQDACHNHFSIKSDLYMRKIVMMDVLCRLLGKNIHNIIDIDYNQRKDMSDKDVLEHGFNKLNDFLMQRKVISNDQVCQQIEAVMRQYKIYLTFPPGIGSPGEFRQSYTPEELSIIHSTDTDFFTACRASYVPLKIPEKPESTSNNSTEIPVTETPPDDDSASVARSLEKETSYTDFEIHASDYTKIPGRTPAASLSYGELPKAIEPTTNSKPNEAITYSALPREQNNYNPNKAGVFKVMDETVTQLKALIRENRIKLIFRDNMKIGKKRKLARKENKTKPEAILPTMPVAAPVKPPVIKPTEVKPTEARKRENKRSRRNKIHQRVRHSQPKAALSVDLSDDLKQLSQLLQKKFPGKHGIAVVHDINSVLHDSKGDKMARIRAFASQELKAYKPNLASSHRRDSSDFRQLLRFIAGDRLQNKGTRLFEDRHAAEKNDKSPQPVNPRKNRP